MKKTTIAFVIILLITFPFFAHAQPHPNDHSLPGGGNTVVGGGASMESGVSILLLLGAVYSGRKFLGKGKQDVD